MNQPEMLWMPGKLEAERIAGQKLKECSVLRTKEPIMSPSHINWPQFNNKRFDAFRTSPRIPVSFLDSKLKLLEN